MPVDTGGGGGMGTVDDFVYPNPQPTDGALVFGDVLAYDCYAAVEVRQRWSDTWAPDDTLVCTSVSWTASPTIPTATLVYRYGFTMERDTSTGIRNKRSLGGYYVRITVTCVDGVRKWYGFIDDTADEQTGVVDANPTGRQTFSCVGIIEALNRDQLHTSYFDAFSSTFATPAYASSFIAVALSPPHFNPTQETKNRYYQKRVVPNFTPSGTAPEERQTYLLHAYDLYNQTINTGDRWSTRDIVEYLCAYGTPRDYANKEQLPVWLYVPTDAALNPLPNYDSPDLDCDGLTLREAFDQLLNANASLGYWVWVHDPTNRIYIEPYTLADVDYTVTTNTLKANTRQITVANPRDPVTSFSIQRNESAYANQVVCMGAKRQVVLTIKMMTEIKPGWTATLTDAFLADIFTYDTGNLQDLYTIRDLREQGRYRSIDRNWKLNPSWNFQYSWTSGGTVFNGDVFIIDVEDFTKTFTTANARYLPFPFRLRILNSIPLKEDIAYHVTDEVLTAHKASRAAYRDIEIYGRKHGDGTMNGDWNEWTRRGVRNVNYSDLDPSYHLSVTAFQDDGLEESIEKKNQQLGWGLRINVDGAFQGVLGSNTSIGSGDAAPNVPRLPPENLLVTLALEDDRRLAAAYPSTAPSGVDAVRRRIFDFGERFQLIEILRDTVVGTSGADLLRSPSRRYVRDDRDELKQVAQQIARYYSTTRNILRGTSRRVTATLWPGQLIKKSNPSPLSGDPNPHESVVNCVVTEVAITFPIGTADSRPKPTMTFATSRGEMDPLRFIPKVP